MNVSRIEEYGKGIFYDNNSLQMKKYLSIWGDRMLNCDGRVITIADYINERHSNNDKFFIRPNDDTKSFSGYVTSFGDFKAKAAWADGQNPYYNMDTLILVCNPKQIEKEWRNIIVSGKVVSSSRYSVYGKKSVDIKDIPDEMIEFTESCCKIYTPHHVFVMDVALSRDKYYIVECNYFNDSSFYDHDIQKIVKSINNYLRERN